VLLDLQTIYDGLIRFYWPFTRVAGLMLTAPVLSAGYIPTRIRVVAAVAITLLIAPQINVDVDIDVLSAEGMLRSAMELLIGVSIGLFLLLIINAVIMGGESLATTMGLGYAMLNDPSNGVQVPIVSQFYTIFVTLIFLALNGHHALLQLLADSFNYMPIGTRLSQDLLWQLLEWSTVLFSGALLIALPALSAMLTVNIVMGVMTRSAPQLNIFSVGFPVTMTVGFLVILLPLPIVAANFEELTERALAAVQRWMLSS